MGLIRLAIFLIVAWLLWRVIKSYQIKLAKKTNNKPAGNLEKDQMVKCEYCSVHIPSNSAIESHGKWYCNEKHRQLASGNQD